MTSEKWRLVLFAKDFTGRGADRLYWLEDDALKETTAAQIVSYAGTIVCHDFWLIRDFLFDETGDLPRSIVDLDEFRISVSGRPEDRRERETLDISHELVRYGASQDVASNYKKMFNRSIDYDVSVASLAAKAMVGMYVALRERARTEGEFERFFATEVPVYRLLQKAMSAGIAINSAHLSEKRKEAEFDYFSHLKDYSDKHDMPLETPTDLAIEEKLEDLGFNLSGVSTRYVLEFLPHEYGFGEDTLLLWEFDAAKRVLSSLALSTNRIRPTIDVFGSRTSRVYLRSPALQNMPKKYRSIIACSAGAELCYVDFDQYEVGIMAALSRDKELARLYATGDMYELFATDYLGLSGDRSSAKQLFLSYAYGMSRKALIDAAVSLGADRQKAKCAFRAFSTYEEWKKEIWGLFRLDGHIATIQGNHCKRDNSGPLSAKEQRSAISQIVQGTASLIFKKALLSVSELEDVTILLPMHDALLFEFRLPETPAKVVATFEWVMTDVLDGRVNGKASIGQFVPE